MADKTTNLQVVFTTKGLDKLRGLSNELSKMSKGAKAAGLSVKGLINEMRQKERTEVKSINNTRALSNGYRELARNVDMNSREFREATREANRLDKSLRKMQRTASRGMGGRLRGAAKTAGAIGAAGIFGGAEGFGGALVGGLFGGTQGAIVGGTAGAALGGARQSLGEIGKYNAQLRQQQFALKLIIGDTEQYNQAQEFLAKTSAELAIPQDVIVRQFTALTASVKGAGYSVKDAENVFRSIAAGIRGTGGSIEDMKSAMVATAQVFSKGKVSAEELRQQLGERLPGAFTLFAASMNMTPQMLDKALEQGKVTLDDFLGFSKLLFSEFDKNAQILAKSPAAAGDRLKTEFSNLKQNFGGLFANIGANIQNFTTRFLKSLNDNQENVKKFIKNVTNFLVGGFNVVKKVVVDAFNIVSKLVIGIAKGIAKAFEFVTDFINGSIDAINKSVNKLKDIPLIGNLFKDFKEIENITVGDTVKGLTSFLLPITQIEGVKNYGKELKKVFEDSEKYTVEELFLPPQEFTDLLNKSIAATTNLTGATTDLKQTASQTFTNMKEGMQGYINTIKEVNKQIQDTVVNAFKNMEDALVNFVMTGKLNFSDFARSLIADMTRIIIRQKVMMPLMKGISGIFNLGLTFAKGGVFNNGLVKEYAKGGIVTQPRLFKYASGGTGNFGLMGEAGAEAILPLKRGRSGNLGVESSGGGSTNIVVNVDASGSSVEGDSGQANEFGNVLAQAIQAELIAQKRAGGLLSNA